ncbi:MAG: acyltransferase [Ruminococcaceae bacterium]|nr:acyltransferase [Oscillospiraceae bacterium]
MSIIKNYSIFTYKEVGFLEDKREYWVDNLKVFACILVVLGHFFQSMRSSEIMSPSPSALWFDKTIYFFHVPLFFICSGYLYQKSSNTTTFNGWKTNILKKIVSLGIPYFVFSLLTWCLKTLFANSVNKKVDNIFTSLFIKPISPYWYLYALFFMFLIIPTFKNKYAAIIGIFISLTIKIITFIPLVSDIYSLNIIFGNIIWFVIGMCINSFGANMKKKNNLHFSLSFILVFVFIGLSVLPEIYNTKHHIISFAMGLLGCFAFVLLFKELQRFNFLNKLFSYCAKYTLPIFLMHTIFAAALRGVLNKFGISSTMIHIILGLFVSFACPVIAAYIMSKIKYLDFFLYPNKYIKTNKKSENNA